MRVFSSFLALGLASLTLVSARTHVSHDGTCGDGVSCMGSMFGGCCSADGKCGSTPAYCGTGCQVKYGHCQDTWGKPSPDGTCGGREGYVCKDSGFGDCCSEYLFCGGTTQHCGTKCQPEFGSCAGKSNISIATPSSTYSYSTTVQNYARSTVTPAALLNRRDETTSPYLNDPSCPAINGTTFTTPCGAEFEVQCETDRSGGDIWWSGNGFYVNTVQDCMAACALYPGCINVAWVKGSPKGACYLKNALGPAFYQNYIQGGVLKKNCTATSMTSSPASTPTGFTESSTFELSDIPTDTSTISMSTPSNVPTISTTSETSIASSSTTSQTSIASSSTTSQTSTASISTISHTSIASNASSTIPASTMSTSTRASSSSSVCGVQPTATTEPDCVPCDGQGGSLPYCGADVSTDHYKFTPKTCRTVKYNLDITNNTISPDGRSRIALLVNGQLPGPVIEANWGDTIEVTVNNKLTNNGTSIHFHGIRQLNNSEYDGVPSITQCPIAPGESFTYKFVATNYGTSWYHSHYAIQAWEGVFGPMVIHGPASKEWDVDAGTIMLNDWSEATVDSMYDEAQDAVVGGPRVMDNGLINGKNTWGAQGTANQTGERFELETKFESGKTYLLRIINSAIQSTYKFYIDGHQLEVINMDFTAIEPYTTDILNINIGQRYMVLVKADQPVGDYWMRSDNQNACAGTKQATDIKGIVRYTGSPGVIPTSTAYNYTGECVDEPLASLIPVAALNPTNSDVEYTKDITIAPNDANLFKWYLSGTTFYSKYDDPTLLHVLQNNTAPDYSGNLILNLPKMSEWIYIIIESQIPLNHPIHLHGHDFFVLASGSGSYAPGSTVLNLQNPPRRDTANMPAAGFLVLAFETDNPGAWLMHCHIGWHTSMGFALQIIEGEDMVKDTVKDQCAIEGTCKAWKNWVGINAFEQVDSGV